MIENKICFKCKNPYPTFCFTTDRATKDGFAVYCKFCKRRGKNKYNPRVVVPPDMQHCKQCNKILPKTKEFFYPTYDKRKPSNSLRSICRSCTNNVDLRWYIREYNITREDLEQMFREQNNCCAICTRIIFLPEIGTTRKHNDPDTAQVDHDHDTKKVRGLLCRQCNVGLGAFKDKLALMEKATEYLRQSLAS